jgi:hypothetical protein
MKAIILILFCALAVSAQTFDNGVTVEQVRAGLAVLSNELATLEAEQKASEKQSIEFTSALILQEQSGQITNEQKQAAWNRFYNQTMPRVRTVTSQIALVKLQILNIHQRYRV